MSYLIQSDYLKEIQPTQLNQLTGADSSILSRAAAEATEKATSYLAQRYNVTAEFNDTSVWSNTATYMAGSRVYTTADNIDTIYNAVYPFPLFNIYGCYNAGDKVFWKSHTYQCLLATQGMDENTLIQFGTYADVPLQNIFPDNPVCGTDHWQDLVAYTVPAGTALTNTAYWVQADNRCQELLTHIVNIVLYRLHTRIASQNIPRLREQMYNEAISWLTAAANGAITPNLSSLEPKQGARIRWGGNIKNVNSY